MFGLRKIIKLFENNSVCVCGSKGSGKDMLFGNVIARRKKSYVSNLDYTEDGNFNSLDFEKLMLSNNKFQDIINGVVTPYTYPYPPGSDIYISDVGVYMPAQYCNELNKLYPSFPLYMALSRQVSHNAVHINVQHLPRCWDKIREQSEIYIRCNKCIVLFGKLVIQVATIYDKYQSAADRVNPCRVKGHLFGAANAQVDIYKDNFYNTHGDVKRKLLIYFNKSKHDTYYFEKFFKFGGVNKNVEKNKKEVPQVLKKLGITDDMFVGIDKLVNDTLRSFNRKHK